MAHAFKDADSVLSELNSLGIKIELYRHEAADTVSDWQRILLDHVSGAHASVAQASRAVLTKTLLLRDQKKGHLYLLSAAGEPSLDMKQLTKTLGVSSGGLRFAPSELLVSVLGTREGSVNPFALLNDTEHKVQFLLDSSLLQLPEGLCVAFHPQTNEQTLFLSVSDFQKFVDRVGGARIIDVSTVNTSASRELQ